MPLYEYYCSRCDAKFEMLRAMNRADESTSCPEGHPQASRLLSLTARPSRAGDDFPEDPGDGGCACGGNCSCG
ncbi:MAG TPA: zinc ribbon domain-containing protein [Dehalococcoidia bacterium]|nr:zinc ribbon domain-containing protein [Dehalococcoidia bacterium]